MKHYLASTVLFAALTLGGCDTGPKSGWGFSLPEGDAKAGEQVFIDLRCTACHSVKGNGRIVQPDDADLSIALGGPVVSRVRTYGELVTSIINPSHRISRGYPPAAVTEDGQSKMKVYNDVMTVEELINLVAFLQSQYKLLPYEQTHYRMYP